MLPPTWTVLPAAFSSSAMMVVVVVLPSLPVTAIIVAGADLKEHLHLAGEGAALPLRRQQLRHVRPQARCAEDNVLRQAVQIPLPQLERGPGGLQLDRPEDPASPGCFCHRR